MGSLKGLEMYTPCSVLLFNVTIVDETNEEIGIDLVDLVGY